MTSTKLMDRIFSDETPNSEKDLIADKISEANEKGSSELKDNNSDLSFTKDGNLVKITDNKSGESTVAKCCEDGSHELVAESDLNKETDKKFSNMNQENEIQERLYSEQDLEEVKYFSDLENATDQVFSNIDALEEMDYSFSDLEDAYGELELLFSELTELDRAGYDVQDAMEATISYSEYVQELAEQDLFFSEAAGEIADATNEVKDNMAELIENPTEENKEIVKEKIDELHDVAKEYSEVIDCFDVMDACNYYSEVIDQIISFSEVDALYSDAEELDEVADHANAEGDDELKQQVKALSNEVREYAEAAEAQGHDVEDIKEKLDKIDEKLDGVAPAGSEKTGDPKKEGEKTFSATSSFESVAFTEIH